jgi:hypothetical protein
VVSDFRPTQQTVRKVLALFGILAFALLSIGFFPRSAGIFGVRGVLASVHAAQDAAKTLSPISIDYPENGSIFPPGITAPTFLWRDAAGTSWSIDVTFGDRSAPIHAESKGERMKLGPIDPDCVADSNKPPRLTTQQAATWTWKPDDATWTATQAHSTAQPATMVITGYRDGHVAFSQSRIQFTT